MPTQPSPEIPQLPFIAPKPGWLKDRRDGERRTLKSSLKLAAVGRAKKNERRDDSHRDRRATGRLQVALECEERVGDARFFRLTYDLSTFGLATRRGTPHKVGTRVELSLRLPDGQLPVALDAVVVGFTKETGGMRLAFRNTRVDAVRRIHRFLSSRVEA